MLLIWKTEEIETIVLIPQSVTYLEECCLSKNYKYIVYENSEAAKYIKKNDLTYTLIDLNFAETSTSIKLARTMQLKVVDSNVSDEIKYYSSNPKIATISQEGLLTANSIGAVKITVRTNSGENSVIFDVTVSDENASEIRYLILDLDDNVVLSPNDHDCFIGSNEEFTYTSSDENIVLVDESGNLKSGSWNCQHYYLQWWNKCHLLYEYRKNDKNIKINQTVINLKKEIHLN